MKIEEFFNIINSDFYTGIPDSQLKPLCSYLLDKYNTDPKHHIIAANEGNAVAIAAGYYIATGKIPVVYLQNSGEGNIVNPVASLMDENVYGIPCIYIIGWRGEPGIHDEPQHTLQGQITLKLLDDMNIKNYVIGPDTTIEDLKSQMNIFNGYLQKRHQIAFVIRKKVFEYQKKTEISNSYSMIREDVLKQITAIIGNDIIISTTGYTSRELFEIREANQQSHEYDFLNVGSMGHVSSLGLSLAIQKPNKRFWIIDGDGSVLMHMGSLALIGSNKPKNLIHIVINNNSYETVGGQPSVGGKIDFLSIASACGYTQCYRVSNKSELDNIMHKIKTNKELTFLEIQCQIGTRANLGRAKICPIDNLRNNLKD